MTVKTLLAAFLLLTLAGAAAAQQVTTSQTSTGYFYPLGTSSFYTGCPNNGGTWHAGDGSAGHPGCYTWGYYHFGYDMFNSQTALYSPVFAMASGKVIYVDPNGSWSQGVTDNTAVFVSYSTSGGTNFVAVYGHLLRSSVKVQAGDVVTGGTQIGQVG